ncbi:podocalyxin [Accipiter gentilis]|uniref:podocalyxin n=1 Tax=Astur gentilis TaxID=8957 RepID=UPI0021108F08|nr:podocalyxin [Accipiter gentilis]
MRAPLLLLLLLLGDSSQNVTTKPANPGENGQITTTTNSSKVQGKTPTDNPGKPQSTPTVLSTAVQGMNSTSKLGSSPPTSERPHSTGQSTTTSSNPRNTSPTRAISPTTVQGTTLTSSPRNPVATPTISPQQGIPSASSRPSTTKPPAIFSTAQQKTSTPASLGSLAATTPRSAVLTPVSSSAAISGGLGTTAPSPSTTERLTIQTSDQSNSMTASSGIPKNNLTLGLKDDGVSSPASVTKLPHSSSSSPVQGLASSTRPGSINTFVTPFDGAVSPTSSKASLPLSPGSTDKVSEAAATSTPGADQKSQDAGSVSTKPASTDQSPASAQPSAPALGDQTASSSPHHQHPNTFQNEVICKDKVQNNWPTMYLKEAKTCAEWRTASVNISFFESFCSTGQHAFNASRETCTVMLTSREPRSQHWAVRAVLHLPLDPEKVLEELQEKDKLDELGIANITYDKMEREMIINDEFSTPLIITIITLAGSLLLIAAIYGCCHQRFSQKKDQHIHPDLPGFDDGHVALIFNQRLTEELQTMENGYHDNPTLEVMETSSEMQEKKVNLNGELGDSWIVPLDTLMKEDLEEEEDTHL